MMMKRTNSGWIFIIDAFALLGTNACMAQTTPEQKTAPCSIVPQPDPCGTKAPAAGKSPAEQFPFPGEESDKGKKDTPTNAGSVPNAPGTSQSPELSPK